MLSTRFATPRDKQLPTDIYGEALTRTNVGLDMEEGKREVLTSLSIRLVDG